MSMRKRRKYEISSIHDSRRGGMSTTSINKEFNATISEIERDAKETLEILNTTILKRIRVEPNKLSGGHVVIEKISKPSESNEIKVIVTVVDETHEFLINQVTVK
jgi:ribosomal protein L18E